jgi:hypothetical protein
MDPETRLAAALTRVAEFERAIRGLQAEQYAAIHEAREAALVVEAHPSRTDRENREWAARSVAAEIATTVAVHERTAHMLLRDAETVVIRFPEAGAALAAGEVSVRHIRDLADAADLVSDDRQAEFAAAALEQARRLTPPAFRAALRRLGHRYLDAPAETLRARAVTERRVAIEPAPDGMAWVSVFCAGEHATAIRARIDAITTTRAESDERTRRQRAADAAVALLLGIDDLSDRPALGDLGAVRPVVHLTVPVLTLLGHGDQAATLDGEPIDIETATALTARAPSLRRLLTDPETGATLRYGRTTRRVPADLAGLIRERDGICRFPGCTAPAERSDLDHTRAWEHGGPTDHDNLASVCRKHHRVKHHTMWTLRQDHDGVVRWRSPSGRTITTYPRHRPRAG